MVWLHSGCLLDVMTFSGLFPTKFPDQNTQKRLKGTNEASVAHKHIIREIKEIPNLFLTKENSKLQDFSQIKKIKTFPD